MQISLQVQSGTEKVSIYGNDNKLPGIAVIFIHGFPFSSEMWKEQASALAASFRVITYDIRGHGKSDAGDGQYSIDLFADDLLALIDLTGLEKVVLCGLSMGGYIALRAMEKFPERIAGLILCDTQSKADGNEAKIKRFETIKLVRTEGVEKFAGEFVKKIFAPSSLENKIPGVEMISNIIKSNSVNGICGTLLALAARTDTSESLKNIKVPALIITGKEDKITTPAEAEFMHQQITGSELQLLPGAAHLSNLENQNGFNEALAKFLSVFKTESVINQ
jgi:3-oxoadipate enol-lactonase